MAVVHDQLSPPSPEPMNYRALRTVMQSGGIHASLETAEAEILPLCTGGMIGIIKGQTMRNPNYRYSQFILPKDSFPPPP